MKNHISDDYRITAQDAQEMLEILTRHDGSTLTPEKDFTGRKKVSRLFDKLRFNLGAIVDQGEK